MTRRRDFLAALSRLAQGLMTASLGALPAGLSERTPRYFTRAELSLIDEVAREVLPARDILDGTVSVARNLDAYLARFPRYDLGRIRTGIKLLNRSLVEAVARALGQATALDRTSVSKYLVTLGYYGDANGEAELPPERRRIWPRIHYGGPHPVEGERQGVSPHPTVKSGILGYADIAARARDGRLALEADVCIVGSGAGGSLVAAELAASGMSVIVLEKGRHVPQESMTEREFEMAARLYNEDLYHPAEGNGARIPILRGECLGGSSVVADAICVDPPEKLLSHWASLGLRSFSPKRPEIARLLAEVKRAQSIGPVKADTVNANNRIFRSAVEQSGYSGRLVERNLPDGTCHQAGFCVQGCRSGDKQSALNTYIPRAIAHGATFLTECRTLRIDPSKGSFRAIAECRDRSIEPRPRGKTAAPRITITVKSPILVLAAGAVETPRLLLRSPASLDPDRLAGTGFTLHYQTFVLGHLPGVKVRGFEGLPVSYQCDEFSGWSRAARPPLRGAWLDAAFSHPWNLATTFRFYGRELLRIMDHYDELLGCMVYVSATGAGRVRETSVSFDINEDDHRRLLLATQVGAGLFFKAGATRIWTGATQQVLAEPRDLAAIASGPGYLSRDAFLYTSHPMGGAAMGKDPRTSLVDEHGESHHARRLYVADASAFPTAVGAPPYVTVMLHARKVAERIVGRGLVPRRAAPARPR